MIATFRCRKERNQDKIVQLVRSNKFDRIASRTIKTKIPHLSNFRKIRCLPNNKWLIISPDSQDTI